MKRQIPVTPPPHTKQRGETISSQILKLHAQDLTPAEIARSLSEKLERPVSYNHVFGVIRARHLQDLARKAREEAA